MPSILAFASYGRVSTSLEEVAYPASMVRISHGILGSQPHMGGCSSLLYQLSCVAFPRVLHGMIDILVPVQIPFEGVVGGWVLSN